MMSLRKIAKELDVSHTLLVLWRQKKKLSPELAHHYYELIKSEQDSIGYKNGGDFEELGTNPNQQRGAKVRCANFTPPGNGYRLDSQRVERQSESLTANHRGTRTPWR
jgi:hypothetical protein